MIKRCDIFRLICDGFKIKMIAPLPLGRGWGGAYKVVSESPANEILCCDKSGYIDYPEHWNCIVSRRGT